MDTWTVVWSIAMLGYVVNVAFYIWEAVQQRSPWKMILYTGIMVIAVIYWLTLPPWVTRSTPPPAPEYLACTSLLTGEGPLVRVKVNGQPVPFYVVCRGVDGEMTSVRAGGDAL